MTEVATRNFLAQAERYDIVSEDVTEVADGAALHQDRAQAGVCFIDLYVAYSSTYMVPVLYFRGRSACEYTILCKV